ncbi:MAG TPA: hypothetical protein VGC69_04385 [Bordetella sp.]
MIPVSLPGGNYYLCMAVSLACLSTLLTWVTRLAIDRQSRLWLRAHRHLGPALMTALAVAGGLFPYQQMSLWLAAQRDTREAQARRTVLDQAQLIAGIAMPAGTILLLDLPKRLDSFVQADFPQAVAVAGLQARQVFRHVRPGGGSLPARETWSVALAADQAAQGWTCSRSHRVELVIDHDKPRFDSCHLAAGNTLDGQPLPAGTWLAWRQASPPRWLLSIEGSEAAQIEHLPLLKADVIVDGPSHIVSFEGLLAQETKLGDMIYPTGTRAGSALNVPGAKPGDLLFSPPRGRSARRAGQSDVQSGNSVLQAPDGTVRLVLNNRQAGVLDVATMRIGP